MSVPDHPAGGGLRVPAWRAAWRLLRTGGHVLYGLWVVQRVFPRLTPAERHARIGAWSAALLRGMGLTLEVSGQAHAGPTLLAANHVSWLDIAALHAAVPAARFVAKADVADWPLLGGLVAGAGTLFIRREQRRDALRVVHAMAEALAGGQCVAVFPEGTTGPGPEPLPLHANLLQAAVATATAVQPAVLRYAQPGQCFSDAVRYLGGITLLQSAWRVASADRLTVHVDLLPALASAGADRRALAATLQGVIAGQLRLAR